MRSIGTANLPSKHPRRRFADIIANAEAAQRYTAGMAEEAFLLDDKTVDAVERCLERISEAASKLGAVAETLVPDIPWAQVRALGNKLRHEYDTIDRPVLWKIVEIDLPAILAASRNALLGLDKDA